MKTLKKLIISWGPAVIWMGIIFGLSSFSSLPGPQVAYWNFIFKKSAHMLFFGILFFLFARAINYKKPISKWNFVIAFFLTIAYSITDELHQSITPGRHPQFTDVGYDALGSFISYIWLIGLL